MDLKKWLHLLRFFSTGTRITDIFSLGVPSFFFSFALSFKAFKTTKELKHYRGWELMSSGTILLSALLLVSERASFKTGWSNQSWVFLHNGRYIRSSVLKYPHWSHPWFLLCGFVNAWVLSLHQWETTRFRFAPYFLKPGNLLPCLDISMHNCSSTGQYSPYAEHIARF